MSRLAGAEAAERMRMEQIDNGASLSVAQAAKTAGRHISTIYRAIHGGRLEAHLELGRWRMYPTNVERWLALRVHSAARAILARDLYASEGSLRAVARCLHVSKDTARALIVRAGGRIKPPPKRGNWDAYEADLTPPRVLPRVEKMRNPGFLRQGRRP